LDATDSVSTKQKFRYLKKRGDLVFRVEAFNAVDVESMRSFARKIAFPIGGCFLMILHLIDGLFMAQTEDTFHTVARSKLRVFQAFSSVFDMGSLDFFMSFSSMMAVTGNIGQSNYATANAILDGELRKYPNAFSLMIPGISGVGYLARSEGDAEHSRLDSWSITPDSKWTALIQRAVIMTVLSAFFVYQGWPPTPRCRNKVLDVYSALIMGWGREGHGSFFGVRPSSFTESLKFPWTNTQRQRTKRPGLFRVTEAGCRSPGRFHGGLLP
jgi:hypothetical protein